MVATSAAAYAQAIITPDQSWPRPGYQGTNEAVYFVSDGVHRNRYELTIDVR